MKEKRFISEKSVSEVTKSLLDSIGETQRIRIERGVKQVAQLWQQTDGTNEDFTTFCMENFIADSVQLDVLYKRLEKNFETLSGYFNEIDVTLK